VFYTSFTDRQFASGQETEFVGFENYRRLLSVKVQQLEQEIDPDTNQPVFDEEGNPVYERPIAVLPREPIRYREYKQFSLFGNRYVLGATDVDFIDAIFNTLMFTVSSVILELSLGLGIALVVNSSFKGRGATRTAMLIPWAVITVVSARMWEWMLAPNRTGFFNTLLGYIG
jgi:trehalose/maltose transport system permease protein